MIIEYKGFWIEKINPIQVGHEIVFTAGTLRKKTRKIGTHYLIHYPDSNATKTVKTMKAAKQYIDQW